MIKYDLFSFFEDVRCESVDGELNDFLEIVGRYSSGIILRIFFTLTSVKVCFMHLEDRNASSFIDLTFQWLIMDISKIGEKKPKSL